jgi:hypothetical protein
MSALDVPSTLETIKVLTLNTLPDAEALLMIDVAAVVVKSTTEVFPIMVATFTILGAAMFNLLKV